MKSLVTTLLAVGSIFPTASYALSVDDLIDAAKENGTYTESHASASSGGQHAEGGESVTTGDVSASSHIETKINANGDGKVRIKIETSKDGATETKEYSKPVGKDGVTLEANASVGDDGETTDVHMDDEKVEPTEAATATAEVAAAASIASSRIGTFFTEKIPNFFKKVAGFFDWL